MSSARNTSTVDAAVVGGGVIGLSAAWRLAQRGLSVALFERGQLGRGASHVAAGMLAPVSEVEYGRSGRRGLELGLASCARWPAFTAELEEASGQGLGLRRCSTLMVARDRDEAEALERELAHRESLGLRAVRLAPSEAREREPALAPTIRMALEAPDDHSVDPRRVTAALHVAAERAGARLHAGSPVARLVVEGSHGRVAGVELDRGERVAAAHVVVAGGAWTSLLGGIPAHARIPVRPVKGQTLRLRDPAGSGLLQRVLRHDGGYVVPRQDGRYVLGATMEERGFDTTATAGAVYELLRDAQELVPGIAELVVEELAVGLRPATPDNLPAIGAGALDGLVWATGHHRNGILLTPLTAELVAAAVTGGAPPAAVAAAADACRPDRLRAAQAAA